MLDKEGLKTGGCAQDGASTGVGLDTGLRKTQQSPWSLRGAVHGGSGGWTAAVAARSNLGGSINWVVPWLRVLGRAVLVEIGGRDATAGERQQRPSRKARREKRAGAAQADVARAGEAFGREVQRLPRPRSPCVSYTELLALRAARACACCAAALLEPGVSSWCEVAATAAASAAATAAAVGSTADGAAGGGAVCVSSVLPSGVPSGQSDGTAGDGKEGGRCRRCGVVEGSREGWGAKRRGA